MKMTDYIPIGMPISIKDHNCYVIFQGFEQRFTSCGQPDD